MSVSRHSRKVSNTDVLIAGGGPTGLTLAIVLRRYGVDVRIIDKEPQFHVHSRGKGIQPRTLEVFDDLGIVAEVRANGIANGAIRFYTNKELVADVALREPAPRPGIPYPGVMFVPQWQTERILRDRLEQLGIVLERGRTLMGFEDTGDAVVATIDDVRTGQTEEIHARYLVGADGGKSFVRKQLGLHLDGETLEQYWVLGDMDIEGLGTPRNVGHAWFADDDSYLSIGPMPGMTGYQVHASVRPNDAGKVEPVSLELFQRLLEERTGLPNIHASNATWLSNHNVKQRMVDQYRKGRVFVAGDAAHIHSPAGGQGLNTGVQDAYNLGWKLGLVLQGKAGDDLLDTYEEERLPIARGVLNLSGTGNSALFSTNPVISLLRRFVLLPILEMPQVTEWILLRTAQLDLNYRDTSLARDFEGDDIGLGDRLAARRSPQAGDRAPDARLEDAATGTPTRLFDQFRGPHWTLLMFAGAQPDDQIYDRLGTIAKEASAFLGADLLRVCMIVPANDQPSLHDGTPVVLLDTQHEAQRLYGARHDRLYLVRPDGYIGFRGEPALLEPLRDYLGRVFPAAIPSLPA